MPRDLGERHEDSQNRANSFFKHKYLTQPAMTDTDALIQSADDLSSALQNAKPESDAMKAAVNVLVNIFKQKANIEASPADEKGRGERTRNVKG